MTRRRTAYDPRQITFADFSVNGETLELQAESTVRLSLKEYELLRLFVSRANRTLDEKAILEHIWGQDETADADTVFLYVSYLRRKLQQVSSQAGIPGDRENGYRLIKHSDAI